MTAQKTCGPASQGTMQTATDLSAQATRTSHHASTVAPGSARSAGWPRMGLSARFSRLFANTAVRRTAGSLLPFYRFLGRGKVGDVPATAQGRDQQHAVSHLAAANAQCGSLVGQCNRLDGDGVEIADSTCLVLVRSQGHGLLRRFYRLILYPSFLREDAARSELHWCS